MDTVSEHLYCVAIAFKMTEQVEQWICLKFCIKFEHSSTETIWVIQRQQLWSNWWLAASSRQCAHPCITSHAKIFGETLNHPDDSAPYSPDLVPCDFWLFPKGQSPLKGKRFQTVSDIQEITAGQLMVIGKTVWSPKVPTLKGTEVSLSWVQCVSWTLYLLQ